MTKQTIVFGAFKTPEGAHRASDRLVSSGFNFNTISILLSDRAKENFAAMQDNTKGPEGAAVGGATGATIGALVSGLSAVAAVTIPGVGLLAAGPLVAALAGGGAGAATGGLVGGLIGLGISEHEAKLAQDVLDKDGIVMAVQTNKEKADQARKVLREAGSIEVESVAGHAARV